MNGGTGKSVFGCKCDTSVLKSLWSLADWSEGVLTSFCRELEKELKPTDKPTNEIHLSLLKRFGDDYFAGISVIRNTKCKHPDVCSLVGRVGQIHDSVEAVHSSRWRHDLVSSEFVPSLLSAAQEMLHNSSECKKEIGRAINELNC